MQNISKSSKAGANLDWKVLFSKRNNLLKCVSANELREEDVKNMVNQTSSEDFRLFARPKFKNLIKNCSDNLSDVLEVQSIFKKVDLSLSDFKHLDSENVTRLNSILNKAKQLANKAKKTV